MNEHRIHQAFQISVLLKGAPATAECIGGIGLAVVSTSTIVKLVNALTQEELTEDPKDFIATHALALAQGFSVETQHFHAFYLLSHGAVKLLLVVGLLMNKLWSYPASLIVLGLFIVLSAVPLFLHPWRWAHRAHRVRYRDYGADPARIPLCAAPSANETALIGGSEAGCVTCRKFT